MIESHKRNCKFALLKPYSFFAKDRDFIEVTEWFNGEGFDVTIGCNVENKHFSLTWGEYEALLAVVSYKEDKNT